MAALESSTLRENSQPSPEVNVDCFGLFLLTLLRKREAAEAVCWTEPAAALYHYSFCCGTLPSSSGQRGCGSAPYAALHLSLPPAKETRAAPWQLLWLASQQTTCSGKAMSAQPRQGASAPKNDACSGSEGRVWFRLCLASHLCSLRLAGESHTPYSSAGIRKDVLTCWRLALGSWIHLH